MSSYLSGSPSGKSRRRHQADDDDDGFQPIRPPARPVPSLTVPEQEPAAQVPASMLDPEVPATTPSPVPAPSPPPEVHTSTASGPSFIPDDVPAAAVAADGIDARTNNDVAEPGAGAVMPRSVKHLASSSTFSADGGPTFLSDDPMNDTQTNNRDNMNNRRNLTVEEEDIKAKERARRANQTGGVALAPGAVPSVASAAAGGGGGGGGGGGVPYSPASANRVGAFAVPGNGAGPSAGPTLLEDNPMNDTPSNNRNNMNNRRNLTVEEEDIKAKERARRANQTGGLALAPGAVPSVASAGGGGGGPYSPASANRVGAFAVPGNGAGPSAGPTLLEDNPMNDTPSNNRNNMNNRNLTVEQEDIKAKERARRANQGGGLALAPGAVPSVGAFAVANNNHNNNNNDMSYQPATKPGAVAVNGPGADGENEGGGGYSSSFASHPSIGSEKAEKIAAAYAPMTSRDSPGTAIFSQQEQGREQQQFRLTETGPNPPPPPPPAAAAAQENSTIYQENGNSSNNYYDNYSSSNNNTATDNSASFGYNDNQSYRTADALYSRTSAGDNTTVGGGGTVGSGMTDVDSMAAPLDARVVPDENEVASRIAERLEEDLRRQLQANVMYQNPQQEPTEQQRGMPQQQTILPVDGENFPDEQKMRNDDDDDDEKNGRGGGDIPFKTICIIILVFVLLGIAAAVVVALILGPDQQDSDVDGGNRGIEGNDDELLTTPMPTTLSPTGSPTLRPSSSPTPAPTTTPTAAPTDRFSQRFQDLWSLIGDDIIINGNLILEDESSPQHEAFLWLADEDPAEYDFGSVQPHTLVERYVMALFHILTEGDFWANQYNFLSSRHVCSWNAFLNDAQVGVLCTNSLSIEGLSFVDNALGGNLPEELGLLIDLTELDVADNFITGTIPREIFDLPSLGIFDVYSNTLTGTIPKHVVQVRDTLLWFFAAFNFLTGEVPALEFALCTNLILLSVDANDGLTGTFATEYGQLSNLLLFGLSASDVTGTLPTEMGNMRNLIFAFLDLVPNLYGTIPTELGQLAALQNLFLDFNQLTGTVPTELGTLTALTAFTIGGTSITGSVEGIFCNNGTSASTFEFDILRMDCLGDSPEIDCSCCTICCPANGCSA